MLNTITHQKLEEDVEHATNAAEKEENPTKNDVKPKGKKDIRNGTLADIDVDKFRIVMIQNTNYNYLILIYYIWQMNENGNRDVEKLHLKKV